MQRRSRLPCRVDVLGLLCEIDHTVAGWTRDAKGNTVERLHQLAGRGWRLQDCDLMALYVDEIGRWVVTGGVTHPTGARGFAYVLPELWRPLHVSP